MQKKKLSHKRNFYHTLSYSTIYVSLQLQQASVISKAAGGGGAKFIIEISQSFIVCLLETRVSGDSDRAFGVNFFI